MINPQPKLIIGNWKMNMNIQDASLFIHKLAQKIDVHRDVEVVLAPTSLALQSLALQVDQHQFKLAAQNFYWRDEGAYTGEISANQLRGLVKYGLVGHSERRHVFGETDRDIRNKVQAALRNNIRPILCIGETMSDRINGDTEGVLHDQITGGLANVSSDEIDKVLIAYEPVWAIGTGDNSLPSDAKAVAKFVRAQIKHLFGAAAADSIQILYGGSVTSENATDYLQTPGIDGLLIGGASLEIGQFTAIVEKAHNVHQKVKR